MTYAVIDERNRNTEAYSREIYRRQPNDAWAAFMVYLWNLGHAKFIGIVDTNLGKAFHFDPRHPDRGIKELKWDGKAWRKP